MSRPQPASAGWSRIGDRSDYRRFLADDLIAHDVQRWWFFLAPKYPELRYQRVLRYVEYLQTRRGVLARAWLNLNRVRLARLSVMTGISVPPGVFGPGLSIAHVGSVVVNDQARVGAWCRLHSSTNIGVYDGAAPQIGGWAYIGPGAVLYGAITVGDAVAVGANSVVQSDVPDGVTVAGAPARIISSKDSSGVLPSWFPARTQEAA